MLDGRLRLLRTDVGVCVRSGLVTDQHRIALAVIASALGIGPHLHETAIAVAGAAGTDALAHNRGAGARSDVDHLGTGIGLLAVVGEGHGIELTHRISTLQHATGVFPGDG